MEQIDEIYGQLIKEMIRKSSKDKEISPDKVYQEANQINRPIIDQIITDLMLPESNIVNAENLRRLYDLSQKGYSCIIFMEHYSNFDLPCLYWLIENRVKNGKEITDSIVSMAGLKLNVESSLVWAFTEAYSRIVIYPRTTLQQFENIEDPDKRNNAIQWAKKINRASIREMIRTKHNGSLVLVFPTGTRYRKDKPETARGLKEIDSYIKTFDYMCKVSINGNILRINPVGNMEKDLVTKDILLYNFSEPQNCKGFHEAYYNAAPENIDKKQFVVDKLMEELNELHAKTEEIRRPLIEKHSGEID